VRLSSPQSSWDRLDFGLAKRHPTDASPGAKPALISPAVRAAVKRHGIELVNYRSL
jgi:hypothetical protein